MKASVLLFLLLVGCAVNSITPSGSGLEMDIDVSNMDLRHGWTYIMKPFQTEAEANDIDSINRGKELYLHHCQKCHGASGKGDGSLAKALKITPANLTNLPKDLGRSYILVQIRDGKGSMPQWKDFLTNNQTKDLTNYIKQLNKE